MLAISMPGSHSKIGLHESVDVALEQSHRRVGKMGMEEDLEPVHWRQKRAARGWGDLDGEEAGVSSCGAGSDRLMGWEGWGGNGR